IFLLANLVNNHAATFTHLVILFLLGVQLVSLFKYINSVHEETVRFMNSIQYDEYATYPEETGSSLDFLYKEFNKVAKKMREVRAERDEQYYYLRNIVKHLGIGLITFNKQGDVHILNTTAKQFFNVQYLKNINALKSLSPILVETFFSLKT